MLTCACMGIHTYSHVMYLLYEDISARVYVYNIYIYIYTHTRDCLQLHTSAAADG